MHDLLKPRFHQFFNRTSGFQKKLKMCIIKKLCVYLIFFTWKQTFLKFIFSFVIYLESKATERKSSSILWFILPMPALAKAVPGQSQEPELHLDLLWGWQGCKHLNTSRKLDRKCRVVSSQTVCSDPKRSLSSLCHNAHHYVQISF